VNVNGQPGIPRQLDRDCAARNAHRRERQRRLCTAACMTSKSLKKLWRFPFILIFFSTHMCCPHAMVFACWRRDLSYVRPNLNPMCMNPEPQPQVSYPFSAHPPVSLVFFWLSFSNNRRRPYLRGWGGEELVSLLCHARGYASVAILNLFIASLPIMIF